MTTSVAPKSGLQKWVNITFLIALSFGILYIGKAFLIPFTLGAMIAMLFMPLADWLESKKFPRSLSSLICVLSFLGAIALVVSLLSWQLSDIGKDFSQLQQNIMRQLENLQHYLNKHLGLTPEKQQEIIDQQSKQSGESMSKNITIVMSTLLGITTDAILVLVYIFLLLYTRGHLKVFALKLVPASEDDKMVDVLTKMSKVVQQYLFGLALMIVALWIMYGIGFSIAGVKHALFFAVLCGLLEIVPFVGNITGTTLTAFMAFAQGGGSGIVIGVIVTYLIVQFIQTYVLETLVVGAQVNINPLFTIIALVIGELVWGIGGMVLAIPLTGIVKIVCQHIDSLKPYAFLIGSDDSKKKKKGLFSKFFKK